MTDSIYTIMIEDGKVKLLIRKDGSVDTITDKSYIVSLLLKLTSDIEES